MPLPGHRRPRLVPAALVPASLRALGDEELLARLEAVDTAWDADDRPRGRAAEADVLLAELVRRDPGVQSFWHTRGLLAKWRGDWTACREHNLRALALVPDAGRARNPTAWNLGIAATALRDWPTARLAWSAFGVPLPGAPDGVPVEADLGRAPVRLNPAPRFAGQAHAVPDLTPPAPGTPRRRRSVRGDAEVVWGLRLCPARLRILNVPAPGSGHRYGDVVLHDGDTVGTRRFGGHEVGVFTEIALWQRSPHATLTATLTAPAPADVEELADRCQRSGGAAEDWTAAPDQAPAAAWTPRRRAGLAGEPDQVARVLDAWAAAGPGRGYADLAVALPPDAAPAGPAPLAALARLARRARDARQARDA